MIGLREAGGLRPVRALAAVISAAILSACVSVPDPEAPPQGEARFESFSYAGADPVFENAPGANQYANPILAGFYPDPSLLHVDGNFYLVNSTFAYFPGIPIFHSTDLVNWTQLGNVIDRPDMLNFDGLGMSRGVFAPTITYHEGVYYVVNTCVDCGGNFIVTATDPAGPWSDPIWTPHVGGIDPSLYFEEDGSVYMINNDAPVGEPRYDGHRALWMRRVDPETFEALSEPVVILDGGVRPEENPIWIEGPHIYKVGDYYYLCAAEGGTSEGHSQVIARSENLMGPFTPYDGNPILTQRHLDRGRPNPVTSVGHADLVETESGDWWAVFLGVRPYEGDYYNTGRETFLLPVQWKDGWPVILEGDATVPYWLDKPNLLADGAGDTLNGNFSMIEQFDGDELAPYWIFMRNVREPWYALEDGALVIQARNQSIGAVAQPSFVGRRQQHMNAQAMTSMRFAPERNGAQAGLVAIQNDAFYYFVGLVMQGGQMLVQVRMRNGQNTPSDGVVLASVLYRGAAGAPVHLRIDANGGAYSFSYALDGGSFETLLEGADGTVLSTRRAGGFVGTVMGMYAYAPD